MSMWIFLAPNSQYCGVLDKIYCIANLKRSVRIELKCNHIYGDFQLLH